MDCKCDVGLRPTIEDLLGDPIVQAAMLADGVDEAELRALLKRISRELRTTNGQGLGPRQ
jgi:hypothetical protein